MAQAYLDDLRRKLLEAHERGEGSLRELAQRLGVSAPWAWKIAAQRKRTGRMERVEQQHGPKSKVSGEVPERLRNWVRQQPDLTWMELPERLWETVRWQVSIGRLWEALRRMQLGLKKSRSTPRNRRRPKPASVGRRGGRRGAGSLRCAWCSWTKAV